MEVVAALKSAPIRQKTFLDYFIKFLLSDEKYISQLWSIGHSYFTLKQFNKRTRLWQPTGCLQSTWLRSRDGWT